MGGVSEGNFKITDGKTMEFFGTLSLANNGGFASVRSKARKLGLEKGDTLVAKVRGDGREYMLNLYINKGLRLTTQRSQSVPKTRQERRTRLPGDPQREQFS